MMVNVAPLQQLFQSQFNAAVSLSEVLTKGVGKIAAEAQDYSKSALEANADLLQKLLTAKSPSELFQLQNGHAKSLYELSVSRSRKIGELVTDISKQAADTLNSGAEKSVHVVQTTAAESLARAAE
jgi:phasin family protein